MFNKCSIKEHLNVKKKKMGEKKEKRKKIAQTGILTHNLLVKTKQNKTKNSCPLRHGFLDVSGHKNAFIY
jgi:hypothetical protein